MESLPRAMCTFRCLVASPGFPGAGPAPAQGSCFVFSQVGPQAVYLVPPQLQQPLEQELRAMSSPRPGSLCPPCTSDELAHGVGRFIVCGGLDLGDLSVCLAHWPALSAHLGPQCPCELPGATPRPGLNLSTAGRHPNTVHTSPESGNPPIFPTCWTLFQGLWCTQVI